MQMRPEIQIAAMIKAMTDVIIPAIDAEHKLAIEQSQLLVGMLNLMAKQLPVQFRFDRDELKRLLACARTLEDIPVSEPMVCAALMRLANCAAHAASVMDRCDLDPSELVGASRALREAIGQTVAASNTIADTQTHIQVESVILEMSKEQLLRDRSLMLPQGWEPDPRAVPSIETLLASETPT